MPATPGNSLNITSAGIVKFDGTATFSSITTTQYDVLVGAVSNGISSVGPGSAGQVLQSGGNAANPAYSTATYPATATGTGTILRADGTNWVATTATYPTTTTSQQILYSTAANVIGELTTANSALAATNSSGTLAMRTFSVVIQTITNTGTYTPTSGMLYCKIECVGGGGAGGGAAATSSVQNAVGGGGGGGEYTTAIFSAATIGASKAVTIGAGGTGVSASTGNTGGTTSVGATLISAIGGTGGAASGTIVAVGTATGGIGGTGGTGASYAVQGQQGTYGWGQLGVIDVGGGGGSSLLGQGGTSTASTAGGTSSGVPGQIYGGGGSGARSGISQSASVGAAGAAGIVIVTEYVIA